MEYLQNGRLMYVHRNAKSSRLTLKYNRLDYHSCVMSTNLDTQIMNFRTGTVRQI